MQFIWFSTATHEQKYISKVLFLVIQILFLLLQKQKPTGGIPGNDMKIKESEQLNVLATASGKTANQVSDIIVSELIKRQMIEETPENWGATIGDCVKRDIYVSEVVEVIRATGLSVVKSNHYDAFVECVLIGNGDCPECGGDMEVTDGESKCTGGDGYNTPYEYTPIWEEKTCTHCGYVESNEPSY